MKMCRALVSTGIALFALVGPPSSVAQLSGVGAQFWSVFSPGITEVAFDGAEFGFAVVAGDFDCDGFDDLAIGLPGQRAQIVPPFSPPESDRSPRGAFSLDAGKVLVLYSMGSEGLTSTDHQVWDQDSAGIENETDEGDRFGWALAAGDFNADTCDDLVIGVPLEAINGDAGAGAVSVIYGSASGLTSQFDDFWHQDLAALSGGAEPGDLFGAALTTGDFDNDGFQDLAIGSPGEDIGSVENAGLVHLIFGTDLGLTADTSIALWRGNGLDLEPQEGEVLGFALAAGQFTENEEVDLAIGAPGRNLTGADHAGVVLVVSLVDSIGISSEWSQASEGVPGLPEEDDHFGWSLTAGNFDGEGLDELAVGVPDEDSGNPLVEDAGRVNVLDFDEAEHGSWSQGDLSPGMAESEDRFGRSLEAADFDGDGVDDLAIGVPEEDNLGTNDGVLHILHGEAGLGLTDSRDQLWIQLIDPVSSEDQFGFALAAGYFTGRAGADLAIGVPFETLGAVPSVGGVNILLSRVFLFSDGFEAGNTSRWSSTSP